MQYLQIVDLKNALDALSKERLPVAYEIAKNIRICNKVIEETTELSRAMFEKFADKDDEGKPVQVIDEKDPGKFSMKITDEANRLAYQTEITKILSEDHSLNFLTISKDKIKGEKIAAEILVPLIDIIIE